jgi:hypothetical protein
LSFQDGGVQLGAITGSWATGNPTISWVVSNVSGGGPTDKPWLYSYTFSTSSSGGVSHVILETSLNTTMDNFVQFVGYNNGNALLDEGLSVLIGTWTNYTGNSNPNLPSSVYGLKITPPSGSGITNFTFSFYSDRAPVWGDIYIKDGQDENTAWNSGFGSPDLDPTAPLSDGSIACNILRPDGCDPVVPEPATFIVWSLLGISSMFGLRIWKRRGGTDSLVETNTHWSEETRTAILKIIEKR